MPWWQVLVKFPDGAQAVFGVEAGGQAAAADQALEMLRGVLVPVDLEITETLPPEDRITL